MRRRSLEPSRPPKRYVADLSLYPLHRARFSRRGSAAVGTPKPGTARTDSSASKLTRRRRSSRTRTRPTARLRPRATSNAKLAHGLYSQGGRVSWGAPLLQRGHVRERVAVSFTRIVDYLLTTLFPLCIGRDVAAFYAGCWVGMWCDAATWAYVLCAWTDIGVWDIHLPSCDGLCDGDWGSYVLGSAQQVFVLFLPFSTVPLSF